VLIDANSLPDGTEIEADVCIAGAGAAGIAMAREFIGQGFRVALLESGGRDLEADTQALYEGEVVGTRPFALDQSRMRYFGGTTNVWEGWCRPLDDSDFEARSWVPHSGWPIGLSALIPFYRRAEALCQIGTFDYGAAAWDGGRKEAQILPLEPARIRTRLYLRSPPTRFADVYGGELERAGNVTTYLHANVVEIETDEGGRQATAFRVATLAGKRFRAIGRLFVVALGGVENARLLLLSDRRRRGGVGNHADMVGRFFMEHLVVATGRFLPADPDWDGEIYFADLGGLTRVAVLTPGTEALRRERLMNLMLVLEPRYAPPAAGVRSLRTILDALKDGDYPDELGRHLGNVIADLDDLATVAARKLFGGRAPIDHFRLNARVEPTPDPDNRVTLTAERDRLGQRRVRLRWQLAEAALQSIRRTQEILGAEVGRVALGRVRLELDEREPVWPDANSVSHHHMGTTRMHRDPKQGVVDEHCRVHGVDNLFIAGSSVFPTAGYANPTFTLVALALRTADHIKARLESR